MNFNTGDIVMIRGRSSQGYDIEKGTIGIIQSLYTGWSDSGTPVVYDIAVLGLRHKKVLYSVYPSQIVIWPADEFPERLQR